ncbi:hypothetical protein GTY66_17590 [Streptomyces sp. SID8356]|uniref:hypothetical protein n=1 Tax=unclassified Streptomyces TaxID=2593676 RepID=UPI00035EB9FA|nr:hypothetical protein [Streptomyces sp. CcalMP-8W]MYT37847.1 hypothetical protein [Streptomyces sp. SID8356]
MNAAPLRIELRRSVAPVAALAVLAGGVAYLYLLDGPWTQRSTAWTAQWTALALWTRSLLVVLWPVAVGLGALQGLRDHRSKAVELLASTPRPLLHRTAVLAGALALAVVTAFALIVLSGAVQVMGNATYVHLRWLPIVLVGALSLAAGAVLGLGVGRALPSPFTPPALAMAAFAFVVLLGDLLGQRQLVTDQGIPYTEPNRLSLLSPAVGEVRDVLTTLAPSVHLGQSVWLLGMAATGLALLMASTPRGRLLAGVPLLAGLVLALTVLPTDLRRMYVADGSAAHLVCEGPVCVTQVQRGQLAGLAGPAGTALSLLDRKLGLDAPRAVQEDTASPTVGTPPARRRATVLFRFDDPLFAGARGERLTRAVIAQSLVPDCSLLPPSWGGSVAVDDVIAQSVATRWVTGHPQPLPGMLPPGATERAESAWRALAALPPGEQRARVRAMREVTHSCQGEPLAALEGGTAR